LGKHYRFTPRLAEGIWLAARRDIHAMMDLSDGLAKDLHALTPHHAQPILHETKIPVSVAAKKLARQSGRPALAHALSDGEDFELLVAVAKSADHAALQRAWRRRFKRPLYCIGTFGPAGKTPPDAIDLTAYRGYEHLR
jgi:thiamine-monophosphate kinase